MEMFDKVLTEVTYLILPDKKQQNTYEKTMAIRTITDNTDDIPTSRLPLLVFLLLQAKMDTEL